MVQYHDVPMTTVTLQDGQVVLRDGKVGTEASCCCEVCDVCFVNLIGTYNFDFSGTCNGNPVADNGQIVDGTYVGNLAIGFVCTAYEPCGGGGVVVGLLIQVTDNANGCTWEYVLPGDAFAACPSSQITPVGTYTLTNCADNTTATLIIS